MKTIYKFFLVALCFCVFTNKAMGQFSGGDGSESDPYIITTPEELAELATLVNEGNADYNDKHYKLDNDIDLSGYSTGAGWIPIGWLIEVYTCGLDGESEIDYSQPFSGVFDGNGNTIKNLFINNTEREYVGLFGYIEQGTVKNVGITDVNITSRKSFAVVGGLVGGLENFRSSVSNCYSTGSISASGYETSYVGGLVGIVRFNSSVWNCYSTVLISTSGFTFSHAGGLVGKDYRCSTVSNCYSTGSVNVSGSEFLYVGGLVGENSDGSTVSNCYSIASVSTVSNSKYFPAAGGLVGYNGSTMSNCAALNPSLSYIDSYKYFGRIGYNDATLSNNIAFNNMLNPDGNTTWNNKGADQIDGEDINIKSINADGTLGGRFTDENGWTTENGKLPGLFGNTVDMPEHLYGSVGISDISTTQTLKAHTQNGIVYVDGLIPDEQWFVFDLSGRIIYESIAKDVIQSVNLEIRSGVYIVKSGNEIVKLIER